jgi:hypothetical protein
VAQKWAFQTASEAAVKGDGFHPIGLVGGG